jgi:parallel beta-helix repeat protein
MSYRKRFVEWCQQPSRIKVRTVNPRNFVVLGISLILVLASSLVGYQVVSSLPKITIIPPESIESLTITTDTTLTEDYFNTTIVIGADDITLDGNGHWIIGPGRCSRIGDSNADPEMAPEMEYNSTFGILLEGRTGVTIKNCCVTGFGNGLYLNGSNRNILQENTAYNNTDGFSLWESDGNTLTANTANNSVVGFSLWESDGNTLTANTAHDTTFGFDLTMSIGNILEANTANNNKWGFTMFESSDTTFRDNAANSNDEGFAFQYSNENTLQGNTANNNNWHGFRLDYSNGSILEANTANNNTHSGFVFRLSSNNILTGNTASNNDHGMCVRNTPSSNNRIYHNNFVNNTLQSHPIENSVNTWDDGYPSGGNYWSDYQGVDANGDGIGDSPYVIDENNIDQFPLMTPISVHS